jgi:polygalacturonase
MYAYRVHDVAITGSGTIEVDRTGDMENWRSEQTEAQRRLRLMGASAVPLARRVFAEGSFLRPSCIQFFGCERVLVDGIAIGSIPFWGIHLLYSKNCTVRDVSVDSGRVNNDGVDIDSSRYVVVENCRFNTGDDCIAIKSGRDLDGRVIGQPSEDIVIRDCRMEYSKSAGVAIGSEMSGGIRRVYIARCKMGTIDAALNIKANLDRGGVIEHVRAWNLSIRECDSIVHITTAYHGYMGGKFPPTLEDIELEDIECARARRVVVIRGDKESIVRRVKLRHARVAKATRPSDISNAEECFCEDVQIAGAVLTADCKVRGE